MRRVAAMMLLAGAAGGASAHPFDVPPEQYEVHGRAGQVPPEDIIAGTTYGLVVSRDGGATWWWLCEASFGVFDTWAPEYEHLASGRITATTPGGLYVSDDGCTWMPAGGAGGLDIASTTAVGPDGTLWLGSGSSPASVLRSSDDGATWSATGDLGDDAIWIESIAVAPSDPQRVYVAGATGPPRVVRMWRSDDGGATWVPLDTTAFTPAVDTELPIMAIAPGDADEVYVRRITPEVPTAELLFRSVDGGASWSDVFAPGNTISGVVARPDGSVIAATHGSGIHRADGPAGSFVRLAGDALLANCLTELSDGHLWVCANHLRGDDMGLGRSPDGTTWTRVMTMLDLAGPLECPAGTVQRDECEVSVWCAYKDLYGIPSEAVTCPLPDPGPLPEEPSCLDCAAGTSPRATAALWLGVLLLLARRRRG